MRVLSALNALNKILEVGIIYIIYAIRRNRIINHQIVGEADVKIKKRPLGFMDSKGLLRYCSGSASVYLPVAANQAPVGLVTNIIGAIHGFGKDNVATTFAFPPPVNAEPVVAGKRPVLTLVIAPPVVRQLTVALKFAIGFLPAFTPAASTRPLTWSSNLPPELSTPVAELSIHGNPPPLIPRMGFCVPVKVDGTPTRVVKDRIVCSLAAAGDA